MTNSAPRRDNGLHAPSYDRLRDVETHLVDGLLERLRDVDVAAYSAPTPGRRGPYGDTVIPGGPSDAVWVDSRRRDEARLVTDRYLEEVAAEIAWAGIVADFDLESTDEVPRWPASEDLPEPAAREGTPDSDPAESSTTYSSFEELRASTPAPPVMRPDPDEHFEPPLPPPLPVPTPASLYAVLLVTAGVLLIGAPGILNLSADLGLVLGVAAIAGGVAMRVSRMRDRADDDGDDGAVV